MDLEKYIPEIIKILAIAGSVIWYLSRQFEKIDGKFKIIDGKFETAKSVSDSSSAETNGKIALLTQSNKNSVTTLEQGNKNITDSLNASIKASGELLASSINGRLSTIYNTLENQSKAISDNSTALKEHAIADAKTYEKFDEKISNLLNRTNTTKVH